MRPYINALDLIEASFPHSVYQPLPRLNRNTQYMAIVETGYVPGLVHEYAVLLDYSILRQVGITVTDTRTGDVLVPVPYTMAPDSSQVAIDYELGKLTFHPSRIKAVDDEVDFLQVGYTPAGSVLTADVEMRYEVELAAMQQYIVDGGVLEGPQGPAGTGFQGRQGPLGYQGVSTVGAQGNQGAGYVGSDGFQGPAGVNGSSGPQGLTGATGSIGFQGRQGITGVTGASGFQGVQGRQGVSGPQGLTGIQGPQGRQGGIGPQGLTGFQGLTGVQGRQGPLGNQGNQGTFPSNASLTTLTVSGTTTLNGATTINSALSCDLLSVDGSVEIDTTGVGENFYLYGDATFDGGLVEFVQPTNFYSSINVDGTANIGGGKLTFDSAGNFNTILYNNNGVASPTATSGACGTKIKLYGADATTPYIAVGDYGIGIEGSNIWHHSSMGHKWYSSHVEKMSLAGGHLTIADSLTAASGDFQVKTIQTGDVSSGLLYNPTMVIDPGYYPGFNTGSGSYTYYVPPTGVHQQIGAEFKIDTLLELSSASINDTNVIGMQVELNDDTYETLSYSYNLPYTYYIEKATTLNIKSPTTATACYGIVIDNPGSSHYSLWSQGRSKFDANVFIKPALGVGHTTAPTPTYLATFGHDLGSIGMSTGTGSSTVIIGNTGASCCLGVGQSNQRQLQFRWDYSATVANATANLVTWGYGNPLNIDASQIRLQTASNGSIKIGSATSTLGFYGATPVAKTTIYDSYMTNQSSNYITAMSVYQVLRQLLDALEAQGQINVVQY